MMIFLYFQLQERVEKKYRMQEIQKKVLDAPVNFYIK